MTDETLISACCSSRLRIDLANSTSARSQISAEDAHQKDVSNYRMQRASSAWARSSSSHQKRSSQKNSATDFKPLRGWLSVDNALSGSHPRVSEVS